MQESNSKDLHKAQARIGHRYHLTSLLIAYVVGLFVGNLLLAPFVTGLGAFVFAAGGLIAALPILGLVALVLIFLRSSIENNLAAWCVLGAICVPAAWLVIEYLSSYAGRVSVIEYASLKNVWERASIAASCALVSSIAYYLLIRHGLRRPR